ncbi:MAG TPA: IS1182 family transposase [Candidatus Deferrimicrobiaceae bacterium]|nr:IS1182 family transposase [Candidatus Deferrimicrobiaceae bacterium]
MRTAERRQVELRAVSVDDLVPADHRVRLVWRFVEGLDLSALMAEIKAVEGRPGHPPADPRILVALWLFATIEGIGSAREVARRCEEHLAFQWLCGGVGMNHKTLSDFRVAHGPILEDLLVDSFTALMAAGVAGLERVAQDGVRVRAAAGAASFRRHSTLQECHRRAKEEVERLRRELNADPGAASRREAAARQRAAEDRERRVENALAVTAQLRAMQEEKARKRVGPAADDDGPDGGGKAAQPPAEKEPRASTTDAEARVMKMADGGFRPAYNVQFAADTKSGAVAGVAVNNIGSDMGRMEPMSEALEAAYGRRPAEHLADGGFAKLGDIAALAQAGVIPFVPVPAPKDKTRERFAPRPDDPPEVAAWRQRMASEEAKQIYKERAATVECVNAQARNRGLTRFLVRGMDKVRAVALWHALAHNMACGWRLLPA